jgi:phosphatidylglycerophosphate synthase
MKPIKSQNSQDVRNTISQDRTRTNLLRKPEQAALVYLVQRIPSWMNSDMLTFIGLSGSVLTLIGFVLAAYFHVYYLLLGVLGLVINWFGDSFDGRVAYYRNIPRKWYGFSLDIVVDWLSIILIMGGFILYIEGNWKIVGFGLISMYGWIMFISLIKYQVTGEYQIDAGLFGPTETRVMIATFLIAEIFLKNIVLYAAALASVILFFINISETLKLLKLADTRDIKEKEMPGKDQ